MLLLRPSAAKFKKKKKSWAYSPNTFLSYFFFKLFTTVLPRIQSVFLLCFFTVFSLQKNWSKKMTVWWRIKHHNGSTKELLLESRPWGHVTASATFSPHDSDRIIVYVWLYKVGMLQWLVMVEIQTPGCEGLESSGGALVSQVFSKFL